MNPKLITRYSRIFNKHCLALTNTKTYQGTGVKLGFCFDTSGGVTTRGLGSGFVHRL